MSGVNVFFIDFDVFIFDFDGMFFDIVDDLGYVLNCVLVDVDIVLVVEYIYCFVVLNGVNVLLEIGFGDKWFDVE